MLPCCRACHVALLGVAMVAAVACDDVDAADPIDLIPGASSKPDPTAGGGADGGDGDGMGPAMSMDAAADTSLPNIQLPTSGSICSVRVGAECDGNEDCAGGEVCCGRFDTVGFSYTEIACAESCPAPDYMLCHPGDACPGATAECRASLVLPYDFVGVCAEPAQTPTLVGEAVAGEVLCGDARCVVGAEKCCYRGRFDFASRTNVPLDPHCAPLDAVCSCDDGPVAGDADAGDPPGDDADAG